MTQIDQQSRCWAGMRYGYKRSCSQSNPFRKLTPTRITQRWSFVLGPTQKRFPLKNGSAPPAVFAGAHSAPLQKMHLYLIPIPFAPMTLQHNGEKRRVTESPCVPISQASLHLPIHPAKKTLAKHIVKLLLLTLNDCLVFIVEREHVWGRYPRAKMIFPHSIGASLS